MTKYSESTLKSLKKTGLINLIRCLENNCEALQEMNNNQFRLLMSKEIYRWHDLRKDPNDLPTNSIESVLTEHKLLGLRCYAVCQYTENGFEDGINPAELLNKNVIAWRYIEPFEVEE